MPIEYETEAYYRNEERHRFITGISRCVLYIVLINILVFLFLAFGSRIGLIDAKRVVETFGQVNSKVFGSLMIWQFITAMFLHGGIMHLVNNMLLLWVFGTLLEEEWGWRIFLFYYLVCGVGAGLLEYCVAPSSTVPGIGASGAIFGLLGGAGLLFPRREVYVFMAKVQLKYVVAFFVLLELYFCFMGAQDGIGHWVHISGLVIGIGFIKLRGLIMKKRAQKNFEAAASGKKAGGSRFDNIEF